MQDNNQNNNHYSYGEQGVPQTYYNNGFNDKKQGKGGFARGIAVGVVFSMFAFFCVILLGYFMNDRTEDSGTLGNGNSQNSIASLFGDDSDLLTDEEIDKLQQIQAYIDNYSYYEQDRGKFIDGMYSSLLQSIDDDYAVYYNEESYSSLMETSSGTYSGIGCVVTQNMDNGQVIVVQPYKGSPAYEAGIAIGDIILKIDDIEITGMDLNEAVSYIKGEEGTTVNITYVHDGEEKTVEVERRTVEIPTVEYEMLENSIGYIKISDFDEITIEQFGNAIEELKEQGAKGFVFDVRSNPGGLYNAVVDMLDMLLPEGTLVYTEDKYGNRQTETSDEQCLDMPMAVLINGDSASASEIFAGALKDYDAAEIIGTKSFGKGIVQTVLPLGDGTGIKFTVASYFTPSGVCIHGIGIEPDQIVELPDDENAYDDNGYLKEEYDTQLKAAVEYLKGEIK
ncbi:MAG: S41 family peptidase [Lachnospiraceae bacterium]